MIVSKDYQAFDLDVVQWCSDKGVILVAISHCCIITVDKLHMSLLQTVPGVSHTKKCD